MAGLEGFDTDSESVAEPGESSFESFDLRLYQFCQCMIVKAEIKKIGVSKSSEKKNRQISWGKKNRHKKQNLSRPS